MTTIQFSMKDLLNEQAIAARVADLRHAHNHPGKDSLRLARAIDAKAIKAYVDQQREERGQDGYKLDLTAYKAFRDAEIVRLAAEGVGAHQFTAELSQRLDVSPYGKAVRRHDRFNGKKNVGTNPADILLVEQTLVELEQADAESKRIGLEIDGNVELVSCSEQSPACVGEFLPQTWTNPQGYQVGNFTVESTVNQRGKGEVKPVCGPCAHEINAPIRRHNSIVAVLTKRSEGKPLDERDQRLIRGIDEVEAKAILAGGFKRAVKFTDRATADRDSGAILGARQNRTDRFDYRQRAVAGARGAGDRGRGGFRHSDSGRPSLPRGMSRKQFDRQQRADNPRVYTDGDDQ